METNKYCNRNTVTNKKTSAMKPKEIKCPVCGGEGQIFVDDVPEQCTTCGGEGTITINE